MYVRLFLVAAAVTGSLLPAGIASAQKPIPSDFAPPKPMRIVTVAQAESDDAAKPASQETQTPEQPATPAADKPAAEPADPLRAQVEEAVEISRRRFLDGNVHTPWQILHGILALRNDYEIKIDGEKTSALAWMQKGQTYRGLPWVERTQFGGRFHTYTQPWHFEGHPNQFLAILTMSDLPKNFTFQGQGGPVTIEEMVNHAKMTVNTQEEITWTLWALSKYLPPNAQWQNQYGEFWSMERLVQIQNAADVNDAACGGTHGLFALSRARNAYLATGMPLRGVWLEADQKIKRYISMARSMQYADGTLSCDYFAMQSYKQDFAERLAPTGHTLEFLMVALRDEQLKEAWVRNAVAAVTKDLTDNRNIAVDCGPLYHALSGLVLYLERTAPPAPPEVAAAPAPAVKTPSDDEGPIEAPKPAPEAAVSQGQSAE